ncbi:hypothetical protein [Nostoc sp.]|uniref:hypothetical protein n=1 Tax=Nostoc sp. TaxID=1180 RepID=UPI003FA53B94
MPNPQSLIPSPQSPIPFTHQRKTRHDNPHPGFPKAVSSTIHYLQVIGYASVGDWSPLLPTANPGEVMSILSRQILTQ